VVGVDGGVSITVVSHEPLRSAVVALVANPRHRLELTSEGDGLHWKGTFTLPVGRHRLRVVVADEARNEADSVLTAEVR
ncbi:MAG TPA: hypothetical protein VGL59_17585, partial [Polyangia bacterium]